MALPGVTFEVNLLILVEVVDVALDAGIQKRIQQVPWLVCEEPLSELSDFRTAINLIAVEIGFQVMELVGVGLRAEFWGGSERE